MKFIIRLAVTYRGYELFREEWLENSCEPLSMDSLGLWSSYVDAKEAYDFRVKNISNKLFKIVGCEVGHINRRPASQKTEFKENDLLDLKDFYNE